MTQKVCCGRTQYCYTYIHIKLSRDKEGMEKTEMRTSKIWIEKERKHIILNCT